MSKENSINKIAIALTWCLAWGEKKEPNQEIYVLKQMREALINQTDVSLEIQSLLGQIQQKVKQDILLVILVCQAVVLKEKPKKRL